MSKVLRKASRPQLVPEGASQGLVKLGEAKLVRQSYAAGRSRAPDVLLHAPSDRYTHAGDQDDARPNLSSSPSRMIIDVDEECNMEKQNKKTKQWEVWETQVLPKLVPVYMALRRRTQSFSNFRGVRELNGCKGCHQGRQLEIACIFMDNIASIKLCTCTPIPVQLLNVGLFACAPQFPSLAVDVNMLEFVSKLFVHTAPNSTAWTATLEDFLRDRQFQLGPPDVLRKRFSAALQWYTSLVDHVNLIVKDTIRDLGAPRHNDDSASDYLQGRCPLCFGNIKAGHGEMLADVIVCMDGNFTQKRTADQKGDDVNMYPRTHPDSVFVSPQDVKAMEEYVESIRPSKSGQSRGKKQGEDANADKEEDGYDGRVKVPRSVLRGCRESFKAADESREKASTQFFIDTDRIIFAIAVFHAYGHQWPCQIVYHPRKCLGFGLSDGEACERLWKLLKLLIPILRVCGHFVRLYLLDSQVKQLDKKSTEGMGRWLARKWTALLERQAKAKEELAGAGVSVDELKQQWQAQVEEQTKPLQRQSKKLGSIAVQQILDLKELERVEKEDLADLLQASKDNDEVLSEIYDCRRRIKDLQNHINKKKAVLSVDATLDLNTLLDDNYLQARMNALAVKTRLQSQLCDRRFEVDALTKNYRSSANAQKLKTHTERQSKRRDTGIHALLKTYNHLCTKIETIILDGEAPPGAVAPQPLEKEGLFALDVDDSIWVDVGLSDGGIDGQAAPAWLADDNGHQGIRLMLEVDRCCEEEVRLQRERTSLQAWMNLEWKTINTFIKKCADEDLLYMAALERDRLLKLCASWQAELRVMGVDDDSNWGPSLGEIYQARRSQTQVLAGETVMPVDREDEDDSDIDEEDAEELERISALLDVLELAGQANII
ncbi:hypothetical protein C8J56DRAFT_1057894 [Mycena floridula]|nr:hypothetical protein C8J56DRAFT_1057894 [Mycena floridula]